MEDRVRLRIMGISFNQMHNGTFLLLLAEENGPVRIPIVIGANEAQSIAIVAERVTPPRPLTHDLFNNFTQAFGIALKEVFIYKFEDGIFCSELTFDDGERQVVLDARTSDAIAIAMRCGAPIFTTHAILDEVGIVIENDPSLPDSDPSKPATVKDAAPELRDSSQIPPERLAVEELQKILDKLIAEENYEEAAKISAIIKQKKSTE